MILNVCKVVLIAFFSLNTSSALMMSLEMMSPEDALQYSETASIHLKETYEIIRLLEKDSKGEHDLKYRLWLMIQRLKIPQGLYEHISYRSDAQNDEMKSIIDSQDFIQQINVLISYQGNHKFAVDAFDLRLEAGLALKKAVEACPYKDFPFITPDVGSIPRQTPAVCKRAKTA